MKKQFAAAFALPRAFPRGPRRARRRDTARIDGRRRTGLSVRVPTEGTVLVDCRSSWTFRPACT